MTMNRREYFKSIPGKLKILTTIFGVIILVLGLWSHFASDWISEYPKICGNEKLECLPLSFEQYFVLMIVLSCAYNLITFVGNILTTEIQMLVIILDIISQCFLALLLLITGTLYTTFAIQIGEQKIHHGLNGTVPEFDLITDEKIYAGALAIIQGLLYIATALFSVCCCLNECLKAEFPFPRP